MDWKSLLVGVVLIIVLGVGGLVYRNVVEHSNKPIACPVDAKVCPDGSSVAREGLSCTFAACPPPNVSLDAVGVAFALPAGLEAAPGSRAGVIAEYRVTTVEPAPEVPTITITRIPIAASSTAMDAIHENAIGGASGAPVAQSSYTAARISDHSFIVVEIERFEGTVDTAYYLAREARGDVLRFDAIDYGADWTNPALDVSTLPAHAALIKLLGTLQGT